MTGQRLRDFDCPEVGGPCADGRCTKEHCCERKRLQAATARELAAKQDRIVNAKTWKIIGRIVRRRGEGEF
jgi:hypothetical protein